MHTQGGYCVRHPSCPKTKPCILQSSSSTLHEKAAVAATAEELGSHPDTKLPAAQNIQGDIGEEEVRQGAVRDCGATRRQQGELR